MRRLGSLLALVLIGVACGGSSNGAVSSPSRAQTPSASASPSQSASQSPSKLSGIRIRLQKIATLEAPLAMAVRAGDSALYVAEHGGRVVAIRDGQVDSRPVLDLTGRVSTGTEQGLLGLAFSADGRFLYVNYTDLNGDTNIVEYTMDGDVGGPGSARRLLFIDQPYSNHNGGDLVFGPDGYLYIGMGDGGSGGDPLHNGQNLGTLLGKMLRIDPRPSGGRAYGIPADNPFASRPGARPEIWDYGLRNPWRYSFDRKTGDLWIGDVGQSAREEVDFEPASSHGGRNYGWNLMEGTIRQTEDLPPGLVSPIYEYDTGSGGTCAIVGGYVYRGDAIPNLVGAYLLSDACSGDIAALRGGPDTKIADRARIAKVEAGGYSAVSFGQDQAGELYVLSLSGPVYKIVPG